MANIHIPPGAAGKRLIDWLTLQGYEIPADCGGRGTCGKCRVNVKSGRFLYYDGSEYPPDGHGQILACRAVCTPAGAEISLPDNGGSGLTTHAARQAAGKEAGYGVALDIGTTTLAASLVNRATGEVLATRSCLNPQRSYGADVISRIVACKEGGLDKLCRLVREKAAEIIRDFGSAYPDARPDCLCVAGNTTMLHIFCGISPEGIGTYPFTPVFTERRDYDGASLGLPVERVILLPSASAYIGSDITGGVYVSRMTRHSRPSVLMDIGTNGEIVLFTGRAGGMRLIAASAAAGPALEGANISCGTGGIPGGVSRVNLLKDFPGILTYSTIGDLPPVGICGSGLVDLVAALLDTGTIDETGYMEDGDFSLCGTPEARGRHVSESNGRLLQFDKIPHIGLTQRDVREFQLAKSAIFSGFSALLEHAGVSTDDIEKIYIAGGLGYYLNTTSARRTGLLPDTDPEKFCVVGNTSLAGAEACLCDSAAVDEISDIAQHSEVLDLNTLPRFSELFMKNMSF